MLTLDHIAVGSVSLDEGVAWVEDRLGVAIGPGGQHDHYGTHNRLLGLAPGLYLEVIARNPEAVQTGRATWFDLDNFAGPPRLANWLCRTDDLESHADVVGPAVPLTRGDLRWETTVPDDGSLPMQAGYPTLLRWGAGMTPPGMSLPESGCVLRRLTVTHPKATWLRKQVLLATDLVRFEEGDSGLQAVIATPDGDRTL